MQRIAINGERIVEILSAIIVYSIPPFCYRTLFCKVRFLFVVCRSFEKNLTKISCILHLSEL